MAGNPVNRRIRSMTDPSDAQLLARVGGGEPEAFAELVGRYSPLVHSLTLSATGQGEAAEELAQEAFCRAYANLDGLRDPAKFRSWLWGITRRVCQDWRRRRARNRETAEVSTSVAAPVDGPAREAELAERRSRVRQAVDELPEKYRIVVQLRHLQGLSYERIAGLVGLSLSGVSNRLAAAREMLRVKLLPLVRE
jgi:RNA polymerase sigma-70 factor (ECF subfamily)